MTRGHWRLDYVALADIQGESEPIRIHPARVERAHKESVDDLERLLDPERTAITFPGDTLALYYELPKDFDNYDYALETRGYYMEWMRQEWLLEENPMLAARLLMDPRGALRELAPAYKKIEGAMEEVFWQSRYEKH